MKERKYLILHDDYTDSTKHDNPAAVWKTVHTALEEANKTAQQEWNSLTAEEKKKTRIYVGVVYRKDLEPWAYNEETGETDWAAFAGISFPDDCFDSNRIYFKIYQINPERDIPKAKFWDLKYLEGRGLTIDPTAYDVVYEGTVVGPATMELFFSMFNDHVEMKRRKFKGHSLSVSDVVEITNDTVFLAQGFYFCGTFDFSEITDLWITQLK